jgi:hypothetical protein
MKLLTKELLATFKKVGRQSNVEDPLVVVKFFDPCGVATWLATEYNPKYREFFGYVSLFNDPACNELGSFSLDELESVKNIFGLGIERDRYFSMKPLSQAKKENNIY